MGLSAISWSRDRLKIIDQSELPGRLRYIYIEDVKTLWQAIRRLKVRGAPALGVAGAFGMYLGVKDSQAKSFTTFKRDLDKVANYLACSRPTAKNLFWAIARVCEVAQNNKVVPIPQLKSLLLKEAKDILEYERQACRKIAFYGSSLIKNNSSVLTICNTGILATIDYGTALGVVYKAKEQGKTIRVYACETRPLLQGARLTAWELKRSKIDVTLICDNMAATLMQQGRIDLVIAGADRIAANGDTANKIGTYNLAVLSHYHGIPFYIAAPVSTFDLSIRDGRDIPIEQRPADEVTSLFFKRPIAPSGVKIFNPSFDITPGQLINGFITDRGVILRPYKKNIAKLIC